MAKSYFARTGVPLHVVSEAGQKKNALIELAAVSKTYRTRDGDVPSLRPIDFTVFEGEFLAIVGPSGCGKSTLLKMIAGLFPPSSGEIRINGMPVLKPSRD